VAPWALGAGLLVSFTASAGNNPQAGVSAAARDSLALLVDPASLIQPSGATIAMSPRLPELGLARGVLDTHLQFDFPDDAEISLSNLPPRGELKTWAQDYPTIDRSRKGDPLVSLRPTLSRRAADVRATSTPSRLIFGRDERLLPPTVLMSGPVQGPDLDEQGFEPWSWAEVTTTHQATSIQSPAAAAAGSTGSGRTISTGDGGTPLVSRAIALSSTTPAAADAAPVEIAAAPVSVPLSPRQDKDTEENITATAKSDPERSRYADLINPDNVGREQRCLAEAIYFEARSEPEEGQAAVAQVVLNRAKSGLYPSTICGVVYQNRHRHLACQFTFACEGKALRITEPESWDRAKRVAREVLEGKTYLTEVGGATHYHANYVRPYWARRLKKMDVIGRHIFYKLRPGQT